MNKLLLLTTLVSFLSVGLLAGDKKETAPSTKDEPKKETAAPAKKDVAKEAVPAKKDAVPAKDAAPVKKDAAKEVAPVKTNTTPEPVKKK